MLRFAFYNTTNFSYSFSLSPLDFFLNRREARNKPVLLQDTQIPEYPEQAEGLLVLLL